MRIRQLIEGLSILEKYYDNPDAEDFGTQDEQVILSHPDNPICADDLGKLREMGWYQPASKKDEQGNFIYDAEREWYASAYESVFKKKVP